MNCDPSDRDLTKFFRGVAEFWKSSDSCIFVDDLGVALDEGDCLFEGELFVTQAVLYWDELRK